MKQRLRLGAWDSDRLKPGHRTMPTMPHNRLPKIWGHVYDKGMLRHLFCVIAIFALLLPRAHAQGGADDKYVFIYSLIQEGDGLKKKGDAKAAADRYMKAQEGLTNLKTTYPDWNKKI